MEDVITRLELLNKELEIELEIVKNKLREKVEQEQRTKLELEKTQKQLDEILYSRSYKLICKMKKILRGN